MPIHNPYTVQRKQIATLVDPRDYEYLHALLPCVTGRTRKILATLYARFIAELRSRGLDPSIDSHRGWNVGHPTVILAEQLLAQCNFGNESVRDASGRDSGETGARDVERGANGVRKTLQRHAKQRPDAQSGDTKRKRRGRKDEKEGEE